MMEVGGTAGGTYVEEEKWGKTTTEEQQCPQVQIASVDAHFPKRLCTAHP